MTLPLIKVMLDLEDGYCKHPGGQVVPARMDGGFEAVGSFVTRRLQDIGCLGGRRRLTILSRQERNIHKRRRAFYARRS